MHIPTETENSSATEIHQQCLNMSKGTQQQQQQTQSTYSSRWLSPDSCTVNVVRPRARSESTSSSRHKRSSSFDFNSKKSNNNTTTTKHNKNTNNSNSSRRKMLSPLTPASLLCYTVINRDEALLLKLLLQYASEINELSEDDGLSPLHLASMDGNTEIMRILLDHGALLNLGDFNNRSALEYAVLAGQFDAAQLLIENGCDTTLIRDGCSF